MQFALLDGGEADRPAMVGVAGRAGGSECLRRLVNCSVMARQAFLVGNFFCEKSGLRDVAGRALFGQNGMRWSQRASGINSPVGANGIPRDPDYREPGQRE